MSIKEFQYLDLAINRLNKTHDELYEISDKIEESFFYILKESNIEFLNISSRVKSPESLSEKIIRNKYYKKYPEADQLIYNLSDLIGVRIECRFGEDERSIYRYLKKYFNQLEKDNYYYNKEMNNIFIKFEGKQPQKQKNGFTIYRIDGKYVKDNLIIPFELQIKSLVNMFWGEIEHEIIYKNSNYIIENEFLEEIMGSIKNNLEMIDKQLVTVFKHFESKQKNDDTSRKKHLEDIVSKIIYDMFANKMKESIGMSIDFKKLCETIIKYTFDIDESCMEQQETEVLIKALSRLNEIMYEDIDFNSELIFERDIEYKNDFTRILGEYFKSVINNEFNWNLFFRILFTLEPLDNAGDFEKFLGFLELNFTKSKYILKQKEILIERFQNSFYQIEEVINIQTSNTLVEIDNIEIVYEYNMSKINDEVESTYKHISNNIYTYEEWKDSSDYVLKVLDENIKSVILK